MLQELWASGTLNIVYAGVVVVSFLFTILTLIGSEIGDFFHFSFDIDADTDSGLDFISISPFAMSLFGAAFGLVGIITRLWFEMEAVPSILWATGLGILIGGLAQAFFIYILSPTKSGHVNLADEATGREAEVITTIPENGLGEIAYDGANGRVKLGARSSTGKQIKRGEIIIIERVTGRVAGVRPADMN